MAQQYCTICHKGCWLENPGCHRGRMLAEKLDAPTCPGCHIGCSLYDPQCGRGLRFRDAWQAGEEIPERRFPGGPGAGGPGAGGPGKPPAGGPGGPGAGGPIGPARFANDPDKKLMFLLTGIIPRVLGSLNGSDQAQILSWLTRQEGAMTYAVMPERARVNKDDLYENLEELLRKGFIEDRYTSWGTQYYWITEEGKREAQRLEEQGNQAIKQKFDALTGDEKQQLEDLLAKLLG